MYYNAPWNWFAVAIKPRQEKLAARVLHDQGLEDYLPMYRTRRRWSDRLKEVEAPLFSGYVFCRLAPQDKAPILRTPGVRSIETFGGRPAPVPEVVRARDEWRVVVSVELLRRCVAVEVDRAGLAPAPDAGRRCA